MSEWLWSKYENDLNLSRAYGDIIEKLNCIENAYQKHGKNKTQKHIVNICRHQRRTTIIRLNQTKKKDGNAIYDKKSQ